MDEYLHVYTTTDKLEITNIIAKRLVEERLAACVQVIGPVTSTYWWQGKIESSQEWLCIIKSTKELYKQVEETIKTIHNYEVPEIVAVPVINGSNDYLNWWKREVRK